MWLLLLCVFQLIEGYQNGPAFGASRPPSYIAHRKPRKPSVLGPWLGTALGFSADRPTALTKYDSYPRMELKSVLYPVFRMLYASATPAAAVGAVFRLVFFPTSGYFCVLELVFLWWLFHTEQRILLYRWLLCVAIYIVGSLELSVVPEDLPSRFSRRGVYAPELADGEVVRYSFRLGFVLLLPLCASYAVRLAVDIYQAEADLQAFWTALDAAAIENYVLAVLPLVGVALYCPLNARLQWVFYLLLGGVVFGLSFVLWPCLPCSLAAAEDEDEFVPPELPRPVAAADTGAAAGRPKAPLRAPLKAPRTSRPFKAAEPAVPGVMPLLNIHKNCYLNAVVQILAHVPYLRAYIDGIAVAADKSLHSRLVAELQTAVALVWSGKARGDLRALSTAFLAYAHSVGATDIGEGAILEDVVHVLFGALFAYQTPFAGFSAAPTAALARFAACPAPVKAIGALVSERSVVHTVLPLISAEQSCYNFVYFHTDHYVLMQCAADDDPVDVLAAISAVVPTPLFLLDGHLVDWPVAVDRIVLVVPTPLAGETIVLGSYMHVSFARVLRGKAVPANTIPPALRRLQVAKTTVVERGVPICHLKLTAKRPFLPPLTYVYGTRPYIGLDAATFPPLVHTGRVLMLLHSPLQQYAAPPVPSMRLDLAVLSDDDWTYTLQGLVFNSSHFFVLCRLDPAVDDWYLLDDMRVHRLGALATALDTTYGHYKLKDIIEMYIYTRNANDRDTALGL